MDRAQGKRRSGRHSRYVVSVAVLMLGFSGCRGEQRAEPPPPRAGSLAPQVEPSIISVPIEVSLRRLVEHIEQKVPVILKENNWKEQPENVKYTVTRGSPQLSMNGRVLQLALPIHCEIEGQRRRPSRPGRVFPLRRRRISPGFSCRTSVMLRFSSILQLTPEWRLQSQTRPGTRAWTQPCEITPLRIDIISLIDRRVLEPKLQEVAKTIDQRVAAQTQFRDQVTRAWTLLQEPVPLRDRGFWLVLRPRQITLSPLEGQEHSIRTTLGIVAQPQVVSSQTPPLVEKIPLPDNQAPTSDPGFHIALEAEILFEQATAELRRRMVGRSFIVAGQTVRVEDARVFGNGDMFVLEVRLEGALVATIYLTGTPTYDQASGELSVERLDFSVETRSILAKGADWFLHGNFQALMTAQARFSLAEQIAEAKDRLAQSLNREIKPNVTLRGEVRELHPRGIYVTPTAFKAIIVADGQLSLIIQ